ncbi:MAG: M20 family metallopeptidase [Chloroflexi bacterium]|nr:M20 family metallopeptidase [Chloroflexota bacterium]
MDLVNKIEHFFNIHINEYLDFHRKMVEINSFTANPEGVNKLGQYIAQEFSKLGFSAEFIQSLHVGYGKHLFLTHPATYHKNQPTIAMISHLDTVFPEDEEIKHNFLWRVDGDRIYGPGSVDIKGGTALIFMIMQAMQNLTRQQFNQINWLICLNASEEALSDDFSRFCLERMPKNTLGCLVFEGGAADKTSMQIVTSRKGRVTFHVVVEGKSAHAGNYHAKGANAIVQIAHTILEIADLTDYDEKLTFNVGKVNGGVVVNRVPHYAEAEVEMRAFSPEVFEKAVNDIMALSSKTKVHSRDGFSCKVKIIKGKQTYPWPRNQDTDYLFNIWQKAGRKLAIDVVHEARGGLSDGNMLWKHFPTLDGLGPTGENAHCSELDPATGKDQEFVLASSFIPKAMLNIIAILELIEQNEGKV